MDWLKEQDQRVLNPVLKNVSCDLHLGSWLERNFTPKTGGLSIGFWRLYDEYNEHRKEEGMGAMERREFIEQIRWAQVWIPVYPKWNEWNPSGFGLKRKS